MAIFVVFLCVVGIGCVLYLMLDEFMWEAIHR